MENCIGTVPIHLKMTLTTKEAAEYSNIGINKIDSMLRSPNHELTAVRNKLRTAAPLSAPLHNGITLSHRKGISFFRP